MHRERDEFDQVEILRIVREFDFRSYSKVYNVDIDTVLGALLGANRAERELSIHGFRHKLGRVHKVELH